MDWETELITLYFLVTQKAERIFFETMRMSPNATPEFSDAELMTIYLYCTKEGYQKKTHMHRYVKKHLLSWFPKLPSYQAFSYRLNLLESAFRSLSNELLEALPQVDRPYAGGSRESVIDSLPIMLSKGNGCGKAKIAQNMADKGFVAPRMCGIMASNSTCLAGLSHTKCRTQPAAITLSPASQHDGAVFFQQIAPLYPNIVVYADKAYDFPKQARQLKEDYNVELVAIHKRQRGMPAHDAFWNYFNSMVSKVRQPIEVAFNWLIEHTDIQNAAKYRSDKGTLLHIFGKIASALCIYIFFNS